MPLPDAETLFTQLVKKIQADNKDNHFSLVGIHTGGAWLAERLHQALVTSPSSSRDAPESRENLGMLGVSFYRDDFDKIGLHAQTKSSDIPFLVDGAHILLVDDVLQSGRTIRAAINELFDYGRPASISLAVLVDRGGRELPVCAQYIGAVLQLPKERNLVFNRDDQGKFYFSMEDVEDKNGSECDDKGVPT